MYHAQNFDSTAAGSLPTGWANVGAAAWAARASNPLSGANSFGESSPVDDHAVLYTAEQTSAACAIQFAFLAQVSGVNSLVSNAILRSDASFANGYLLIQSPGASAVSLRLFKKVAGAYSQVGADVAGLTFANGVWVQCRFEATGTTIRAKLWANGSAEPGSWSGTWTDATFGAAGYAGLRTGVNGSIPGGAVHAVDDLYIGDAGMVFPQAASVTMTGPTQGETGVASTNFTLTPNAAYTGTATPSDSGAGGTFAPTSLTWAGESSAKTFTYTRATAGASTISVTEAPALTGPTSIAFTALATTTEVREASVGAFPLGLLTVGYTLYSSDGTTFRSRVTAGVTEQSFPPGTYAADITVPVAFSGIIGWSESAGATEYYSDFEPNDEPPVSPVPPTAGRPALVFRAY